MNRLTLFPALMFTAGLSGCTAVAVDPHAGFPEVSRLVTTRAGQEIVWTPGTEESPPALEAIQARLKDGLNEEEAVQIALLNNRDLHALYARLGIAQADVVQASLLHNPVIDALTGFPVGGGVVDLSFGVAMDFIDLLYVPLRKRVATARFEETKLRVAAEVLDVAWRTQTAFYRHQANEQMVELRRQVVVSTTASFDLARRMREAGNLRELDLASEQALAEEAKLDLRLTEITMRESRETLNTLMGLWGEEARSWTVAPVRLPEPPREPLPTERLEARAIERSLDLAAAEQLIVAAAENVGLDRASALFPELVVGGKGERDGAEWESGPTLTLPLPLFDRGQARIARAQAELRQARELRHALAVRIRSVTRGIRDRLDGHRDRARHYREVLLPVRDRVLQETQLQYMPCRLGRSISCGRRSSRLRLLFVLSTRCAITGSHTRTSLFSWPGDSLPPSLLRPDQLLSKHHASRSQRSGDRRHTMESRRMKKTMSTRHLDRRTFLTSAALLGGGVVLHRYVEAAAGDGSATHHQHQTGSPPGTGARSLTLLDRIDPKPTLAPGEPGKDYTPVITPNNISLPWKIVDGVKVYHLIAEEVTHEFAPGLTARCWGYNGRVHGPTIEAVEGDRVRIYVTNRLPGGTSVHWHGLLLPNGMDGVAGLTQPVIKPGETFRYEFTLRQHGTFMYHSHHDEMIQMALGTTGLFIIHPRRPPAERPDQDFAFMLSEWRLDVGTSRPNPNEMTDFNLFTFNAKAFPGTQPMVARLGDRVRIRIANVTAMSHHPIHLHGYQFRVTETDGGQIPASAQQLETSVLVAIGQSRTIDFVADEPGDWAMHCHMTHHVMNQMGDKFPNLIGVKPGKGDTQVQQLLPGYMTMGTDGMAEHGRHIDSGHLKTPPNSIPMRGGAGPFDYITMGGLLTLLKVREHLERDKRDPGWYRHPKGTVASVASRDELQRDGITG